MNDSPEFVVVKDLAAVQQAAASRLVGLSKEAIARDGCFLLALSGGSTPGGLYRLLAQEPQRSEIDWSRVVCIWGDERYVPHEDGESSYRLARETLFDHVPLPADNIFPMPTYLDDPQQAAMHYARQLQMVFARCGGAIHVLLLGMGGDGHVASLFPRHAALTSGDEVLVTPVDGAPRPPPLRLSLTPAALNRSRHVFFLVAGADKADAVEAVVHGSYQPHDLPAQFVRPAAGQVVWFLDAAAAKGL